jgi:hypothetical protein
LQSGERDADAGIVDSLEPSCIYTVGIPLLRTVAFVIGFACEMLLAARILGLSVARLDTGRISIQEKSTARRHSRTPTKQAAQDQRALR